MLDIAAQQRVLGAEFGGFGGLFQFDLLYAGQKLFHLFQIDAGDGVLRGGLEVGEPFEAIVNRVHFGFQRPVFIGLERQQAAQFGVGQIVAVC